MQALASGSVAMEPLDRSSRWSVARVLVDYVFDSFIKNKSGFSPILFWFCGFECMYHYTPWEEEQSSFPSLDVVFK